jgi:hypothetical protein
VSFGASEKLTPELPFITGTLYIAIAVPFVPFNVFNTLRESRSSRYPNYGGFQPQYFKKS